MYTIVQPKKVDGIVKAYDKKKVTIIDQEVKAWVLDEDEGMYLVYAMNWKMNFWKRRRNIQLWLPAMWMSIWSCLPRLCSVD